MSNKTAILIFANSAEKEVQRKSFLSAAVFSELNAQTLKTVQKSGIEFFHFSEKEQVGHSFGERFTNAIDTIFCKGFDSLITIGNDTPHLKTHHLIDTLHQLEKNELVLGPSKDGGFYLMGLHKNQFQKEVFLKLPWQTSRLQSSIKKLVEKKQIKISCLEILNDIDVKEDILKVIGSFKNISKSIFKLFLFFINIDKRTIHFYKLYTLEKSFSRNFNKGSPFIFD